MPHVDVQYTTESRADEARLFFRMSLVCAAVAFLGFAPTYWGPLLSGTLKVRPVIHIHALAFYAWSLLYAWQSWLASRREIVRHREWGLLAISVATAMVILGCLAAIAQMQAAASRGFAEAGRAFAIAPIGGLVFFAVTFTCAVINVRRPDWHKRLMLVTAVSILDAAIARWFQVVLQPSGQLEPAPVYVDLPPALLALLLLAYPMLHDWRRFGRPHSAFLIAGGALGVWKLVQVPLSATGLWQAIAGGLMAAAG